MRARQKDKHLILDADLTIFSKHAYKAIETKIFSDPKNKEKFGQLRVDLDTYKRNAGAHYRAGLKASAEHASLQQQLESGDTNSVKDFMLKMLLDQGDRTLAEKHVQQQKEKVDSHFKKADEFSEKIAALKSSPLYDEFLSMQWEIIKDIKVYGSPDAWKEVMEEFSNHGWQVTIASFTSYDDILKRYIDEIIKPDCNITVIGRMPKNPQFADKNDYILEASDNAENKEDILLVDDSRTNILAAKKIGCRTILADDSAVHLEKLQSICKNMELLDEMAPHKNTIRKKSPLTMTYNESTAGTLFNNPTEPKEEQKEAATQTSPRLSGNSDENK